MNYIQIYDRLNTEGLKKASIGKRALSMIIDDLLVSFIIIAAFSNDFTNAKTYMQIVQISDKLFFYIFTAYTLYHWIFAVLYGKTVGKFLLKIKIVDVYTLDNPDWIRALIRSVFRNFDEMFFYIGMAYGLVDPLNRAIHDIVGRCVVIED